MTFYNDNEQYVCRWLRNLIDAGQLTSGTVDDRPIEQLTADDVRQYTRAHFFAGIGGWDYALQWAGWPADRPVWTGSCPCQPFSVAGKRRGTEDERHLWPVWLRLIAECRPATIFGEQVASKDGRTWLSGVRSDLEALGYAVGAADLCAAGVGAPHVRQRLWWVGSAHPRCFSGEGIKCTWGTPDWSHKEFQRLVAETLQHVIPAGKHNALADGVPARASKLRAYGNAIVPQVAAEFVRAFMETEG